MESWTVTIPLGPPSEHLFTRRWTKLTIDISTKCGDEATHENLKQFELNLQAQNPNDKTAKKAHRSKQSCILVTNDTQKLPLRFHAAIQCVFAIIGLNLPYSWFLYFSIGHVNYKIDKKVFTIQEGGTSQTTDVDDDLITDGDEDKNSSSESDVSLLEIE